MHLGPFWTLTTLRIIMFSEVLTFTHNFCPILIMILTAVPACHRHTPPNYSDYSAATGVMRRHDMNNKKTKHKHKHKYQQKHKDNGKNTPPITYLSLLCPQSQCRHRPNRSFLLARCRPMRRENGAWEDMDLSKSDTTISPVIIPTGGACHFWGFNQNRKAKSRMIHRIVNQTAVASWLRWNVAWALY